jgi:hypothetical protein
MIARPPKFQINWKISFGGPVDKVRFLFHFELLKVHNDSGKPGESWGRKANGSKVTYVNMIARLQKTMCLIIPDLLRESFA